MANEQDLLKDLLQLSLSQVEDYASSLRHTVEANFSPNNSPADYEMNSTLLSIEDIATHLEQLVLQCKDQLKKIVPERSDESADDVVDPDDVVPFDWTPPPKYDYEDMLTDGYLRAMLSDGYYDSDPDGSDEFW